MQLRQSLTGSLTAFWLANLCRLRNFEHTHQEKGTLSRSCRGALSVHPLVLWDALQNLNLSQKYPSSLLAVSYGSHWVLRKWASLHRLQLAGWPKQIGMCWVYPHIHCHTVAATEIGVVPGRIVDLGGFVSWQDLPLALEVFSSAAVDWKKVHPSLRRPKGCHQRHQPQDSTVFQRLQSSSLGKKVTTVASW